MVRVAVCTLLLMGCIEFPEPSCADDKACGNGERCNAASRCEPDPNAAADEDPPDAPPVDMSREDKSDMTPGPFDAAPEAELPVDAEVIADGGSPPDVGPDAADGAVDDAAPDVAPDVAPDPGCDDAVEQCSPCAVAGGEGACAIGVWVCAEGEFLCVPWLPAADSVHPCDLVDNDCDGTVDELGEGVAPDMEGVVVPCDRPDPPADPACGAGDDLVGCLEAHTCTPCRERCTQERVADLVACDVGEGRVECLRAAETNWQGCLADPDCAAPEPTPLEWRCAPQDEEAPPTCEVVTCPPHSHLEDGACAPEEICNNGVDDDHDGLVDAVVDEPDRCMVRFDQRGVPRLQGICNERDLEDCGDNRLVSHRVTRDATSPENESPRRVDLTYVFAVDRARRRAGQIAAQRVRAHRSLRRAYRQPLRLVVALRVEFRCGRVDGGQRGGRGVAVDHRRGGRYA